MAYDRFYIGYIDPSASLDTSLRPFAIPDNAFERLQNAYVFRGRVRKRFGSRFMVPTSGATDSLEQLVSRVRILVDTTDGAGAASGTVPGTVFGIGQAFSIGDELYTVNITGAPAALLSTGAGTGTYNTTTGAFTFAGAPATTEVYFYPATPIMGLITYEVNTVSDEELIAFDTQFAYEYTATGWERLAAEAMAGDSVWTGSDSQFFWGANWRGVAASDYILFVTNYNAPDLLRYYDGTQWATLNPLFNATDTIETARIIMVFKNRLLLLNVIEDISGLQTFSNRCRFSQNGSPLAADAWREDIPGRGGFIDAPTREAIITAQFLKDRLIVYFETSTWELVYTGNEILPFRWQQINTELGAESTFSQVPFDKVVLGVGNVGIHACTGYSVERIDQKIPNSVFDIHNENNGIERVYGIRDYFVEMVYWTFPGEDRDTNFPFPNRVLIFNYKTGSWAFNDDSITAFGYYQPNAGITWAQATQTWQDSTESWSSGELSALFRNVVAGNQEGYVFIIDPNSTRNAAVLQLTDITSPGAFSIPVTVINHNLAQGDYILIESVQGTTGLNDTIVLVDSVDNANVFRINVPSGIAGTYTGGGVISRVTPVDILSKQYNFYASEGRNAYVSKVEFLTDKTENGQVTIDFFTSSSDLSLVSEGTNSGSLLGTNVLETSAYTLVPYEDTQRRVWHPVYFQADGEVIQLRIYLSDEQIVDPDIVFSDFQMHALVVYAIRTSARFQ